MPDSNSPPNLTHLYKFSAIFYDFEIPTRLAPEIRIPEFFFKNSNFYRP